MERKPAQKDRGEADAAPDVVRQHGEGEDAEEPADVLQEGGDGFDAADVLGECPRAAPGRAGPAA